MPVSDEEVTKPAAGIPDSEVENAPMSSSRMVSDWATSFIRGLAKGTIGLAGLPGDVNQMVGAGVSKAGEMLGYPTSPEVEHEAQEKTATLMPTSADLTKRVEQGAGKFGEPETQGGKYAQSIGEFAPAAAVGPGRALAKGAMALGGGVGSEAAGELTHGKSTEPYARLAGGIAGGMAPGAAMRVVTPFPIRPERREMVEMLRHEGIEPTAGDVSGSRVLKHAESALGDAPGAGGAYSAAREQINDSYTRAALVRIGETAERATPEVLDRAYRRIGGQINALGGRNAVTLDTQYATEVLNAAERYDYLFRDPLRRPMVQRATENALNFLAQSRDMPGDVYNAQRSMLGRNARGQRDPDVQRFLYAVQHSLDDAMERSIAQTNPADLAAFREARRQYADFLVLERAGSAAGEAAAEGIVSPAQLRSATTAIGGRRRYARGQGDFADLSRAGNAILKPPQTSGTMERSIIGAVPTAIGGALGHLAGGAPDAAMGALAGAFAPGLTGRALMSRPAQAYLKNQSLAELVRQSPTLNRIIPTAAASQDRSQQPAKDTPEGARKAPDGNYYVDDPKRPGKYLQVVQ